MKKWNLTELLESKKPEDIIDEIEKYVKEFKTYRTKKIDEKSLYEMLVLKDKILEHMMRVEGYFSMRFYENTKDEEAASKLSYIKQIQTRIGNEMLFFSLSLIKLPNKKFQELLNSKKISSYKNYLKKIRKLKKYTLNERIEKILNIKNISSSGFFDIYEHITSSFEFKFEGKKLLEEELKAFCKNPDYKKREKAYNLLLKKYEEHKSELSEIYRNIVLDWYNEDILIRKYPKPISSRNMSNDLDDKTIDVLLKVIRKNNEVFQEYFRIKHSILTKKTKYAFSRYHIYAPYKIKARKYDYEYSKKYVLETFKKFDKRFYDSAKAIFDAKHVHSHPQKNKRGGAFCNLVSNKHLPYILLNHTDTIRDVFTMAHELGHGIHDVLSMKQPNLLQHAPLPISETASIFSEMIIAERMLKETKNNKEKAYILFNLLDNQYASITRQAYFVIFEIFAHENMSKGIEIKKLDEEYIKLLKEQFGEMEVPEIFKNEWNYIPHIHETPFYCYAYAFGNLLVLSLYEIYKKEGKSFIEKYVRFLESGGSKSPKELLYEMGLDINSEEFWQRGFEIIKDEINLLKTLQKHL
ncbi:MAG: oligoendopeptidase F [Candidatus Woesearchaeota archaeon]|nr:MAG: oligoendopeptidase F [Candidatus Woesearchaeota archaeon]